MSKSQTIMYLVNFVLLVFGIALTAVAGLAVTNHKALLNDLKIDGDSVNDTAVLNVSCPRPCAHSRPAVSRCQRVVAPARMRVLLPSTLASSVVSPPGRTAAARVKAFAVGCASLVPRTLCTYLTRQTRSPRLST